MRVANRTVLDPDEQVAFCQRLLRDVDLAAKLNNKLKVKLKFDLGWDSLTRLSKYAEGDHFPSAETVEKIGRSMSIDWLSLLGSAGYLYEVIDLLEALSRLDRSNENICNAIGWEPDPKHLAIVYAVARFPRRDEMGRLKTGAFSRAIHLNVEDWADEARRQRDLRINKCSAIARRAKCARRGQFKK